MTTLFQIVLSKKKSNVETNILTKYNDKNPLYLTDELSDLEDSMKNLDIIENNVQLTRELIKQLSYMNQPNEYYFTTNNVIDNIDSHVLYIQTNIPINKNILLLEDKKPDEINVIEDYYINIKTEEEYIKFYKIGENDSKDIIFKYAKEFSTDNNILIALLDGIISRDIDNILNGFIKQYGNNFDNEILFPALEHAILLDKLENAKIIIKYISKKCKYFDNDKKETIKFLKSRNITNLDLIENM